MDNTPFPELLAAFQADPRALLGRMPGVFLLHKPVGVSSHRMVSYMRKRLGIRRVGHGGTLDPLAEGLLIIFAGNATRLFDSLQDFDKEYVAGFRLGSATSTQDITGEITNSCEKSRLPVARERVEAALAGFRGEIMQTPPMYSAIKIDGKRLYEIAREGGEVGREARAVTAHKLELLEFDGFSGKIRMAVSKGFYVRTLIDDLGRALGTYATMTALCRTRIGPYHLAGAEVVPEEWSEVLPGYEGVAGAEAHAHDQPHPEAG